MPTKMRNIYEPKQPMVVNWDGYDQVLNPGELYDEDHPLRKARPDLFQVARTRPVVEQATANPGETRAAG